MRLRFLSLVTRTAAVRSVSAFSIPLIAGAALLAGVSAHATTIPNGTVSSAHNFSPSVNLAVNPSTYSTVSGATFQVAASGGFAGAAGKSGTMNGMITFSDSVGATIAETLNNLFVFADGSGGNFSFSANSVSTNSFMNNPGVTSSFTLYLLGTTIDPTLGFATPTATSLTLTANSTGGSAFSSSASLAVPPTPGNVTPEPSSLVLLGTGILGLAGAARRKLAS